MPRTDDDLHLALYLCYQLHYGGLREVPDDLEWDPAVLGFRDVLEAAFENALLADIEIDPARDDRPMVDQFRDIVRGDRGPSLSTYLEREASLDQFREFLLHRSTYHLKEADPFTWVDPPLARRSQGGARPDPSRRVRRRRRRLDAQRAVRPDDDRAGSGSVERAAAGTDPRHHARRDEPAVAVRAASTAPRPGRRGARAVRDDVVRAEPPIRRRPAAAGLRSRRDAVLRRARRGRRSA